MMGIPLGMDQMNRVFDVVDDLEISRERIQVELLPVGEGSVERLTSGRIGIVLPDGPLGEWLPLLRARLEQLRTVEDLE